MAENFINIYSSDAILKAKITRRNAIVFYCTTAFVFAVVCAFFVIAFKIWGFPLFVCFIVNFLATVAFLWYSVLFFSVILHDASARYTFFKTFANAQLTYIRGRFISTEKSFKENHIDYKVLLFETEGDTSSFLIFDDIKMPFVSGVLYDLKLEGSKITAYRKVENEDK